MSDIARFSLVLQPQDSSDSWLCKVVKTINNEETTLWAAPQPYESCVAAAVAAKAVMIALMAKQTGPLQPAYGYSRTCPRSLAVEQCPLTALGVGSNPTEGD